MPFDPFAEKNSTIRAVRIPADLSEEKRAEFEGAVQSAMQKQARLAEKCDAVLRTTGTIRAHGDWLLIEHEPARPLLLEIVLESRERPDILTLWWFADALVRGLAAAEVQRFVHGAVTAESVLLDTRGRIKVADFGLINAYARVAGNEARRFVIKRLPSEDEAELTNASGVWELVDEDVERDDGWIAPFLAPELLSGGSAPHAQADQFSVGLLLYMLATGVHPFGADFSDPHLIGYFVPEPYALEEEREDWAEVFERHAAQASLSADQPILRWAEIVLGMLSAEREDRFANFKKLSEAVAGQLPEAWTTARDAIGDVVDLLDADDYAAARAALRPLLEDDTLPTLWRDGLRAFEQRIDQLAATHDQRKRIEARLEEAFAALDTQEVDAARAIADELSDAEGMNEELAGRLAELRKFCDEHKLFIEQQQRKIEAANLDSAREALEGHDFGTARTVLHGMLSDPPTSASGKKEAEALLDEVERTSRKYDEFEQAITRIEQQVAAGELGAAHDSASQLVDDEGLPDTLHAKADELRSTIAARQKERAEQRGVLMAFRDALDAFDLDSAEQARTALEGADLVPSDANAYASLQTRAGKLAKAQAELKRIESAAGETDPAELVTALEPLLALGRREPGLQAALRPLRERLESQLTKLREKWNARIAAARERGAQAWESGDAGALGAAIREIDAVPFREDELPEALFADLATWRAGLPAVEQADEAIRHADGAAGREAYEEALAILDGAASPNLPEILRDKIAQRRTTVEQAQRAHLEQLRTEFAGRLEEAETALALGDLSAAARLLEIDPPDEISDEQRAQLQDLRSTIGANTKLQQALADVANALQRDDADQAERLLDAFPAEGLPEWAAARRGELEQRIARARKTARDAALAQARESLDRAGRALEKLDVVRAETELADVPELARRDEGILEREAQVRGVADEVRAWEPWSQRVRELLQQQSLPEAAAVLREPPAERAKFPPLEERRKHLNGLVEQALRDRRAELGLELERLRGAVAAAQKQSPALAREITALQADPLADQLQQSVQELQAQHDALPKGGAPVGVIAAIVGLVVVGGGAGFWMLGGGGGGSNGPDPNIVNVDPNDVDPNTADPDGGEPNDPDPARFTQLATARDALANYEFAAARDAIDELLSLANVPATVAREAETLRDEIDAAEQAYADVEQRLTAIAGRLDAQEYEAVDAALRELPADLPSPLARRAGELRDDVAERLRLARAADAQAEQQAQLAQLEEALDAADLDSAARLITELSAVELPVDLQSRFVALRDRLEPLRTATETLGAIATGADGRGEDEQQAELDALASLAAREPSLQPLLASARTALDARIAANRAARPDPTPEPPPWPAALATRTLSSPSSAELASLANALGGAGGDWAEVAALFERVDVQRIAETPRVALAGQLRWGAGTVQAEFACEQTEEAWVPVAANEAALAAWREGAITRVARRIGELVTSATAQYAEGDFATAVRLRAELSTMPDAGLPREVLQQRSALGAALDRYPANWSPVAGLRESIEKHAILEYPLELTGSTGRWRLTQLAPNDPLYDALLAAQQSAANDADFRAAAPAQALLAVARRPAAERPWMVVYVGEPGGAAVARVADWSAPIAGAELPRVSEWVAITLQRRNTTQLGLAQWCLDEQGGAWACGGTSALHAQLLPPPSASDPLPTWWRWINHPLVTQPRNWGDGLVGARSVLRLYSPE